MRNVTNYHAHFVLRSIQHTGICDVFYLLFSNLEYDHLNVCLLSQQMMI